MPRRERPLLAGKQLPITGLKNKTVCNFSIVLDRANNEGVVLNRACILEVVFPKQGQDFKHSAARLYPNIAQATRSPDVSLAHVHVPDIQIPCFLYAHKTYLISPTTSGGTLKWPNRLIT